MRLITPADDEMVRTINLAMKMSNWERIAKHLRDQYSARPTDPDASFAYAVSCLALIVRADNDLERHRYFIEVLESLNHTIDSDPEHWLGRYYRAMVRLLIPPGYSEMANYIFPEGYGEGEAIDDMTLLIQKQGVEAVKPAYFICPYIVLAHYYMSHEQEPKALDYFQQAIGVASRAPILYLSGMLCQPFIQLYGQFKRAHQIDAVERLLQLMTTLFPAEKAISAILVTEAA